MTTDLLVAHDLQRHMRALELAIDLRPILFRCAAVTCLCSGRPVEPYVEHCVADVVTHRPRQTGNRYTPTIMKDGQLKKNNAGSLNL